MKVTNYGEPTIYGKSNAFDEKIEVNIYISNSFENGFCGILGVETEEVI